ncbi:Hachiman antiphage defense system protein HamA [Sphingobacterium faecium]|uniref:Hachiman antiphage defense system protein HamA n=1 Tax=Sphingobacterium faecium TaxID=34087 RepID=UPI003208752C
MRQQLLDLINNTILFKYALPNIELDIPKTIFSTENDMCYEAPNKNALIEIIYNSIIEYSFNEFEISEREFKDLHTIAFQDRIRFNEEDKDETQLKYGFFGEVILHAILKVYFGTETIISKGYFYNPLENSESKGYDAYHLIENDSSVQLWFGETKFHHSYTLAINDVLSKIKNSLSNNYLKKNLLALRKNKDNLNIQNSVIETILRNWDKNPNIVIIDELVKHSIELVYPVIVLFKQNSKGYNESIKAIPNYIKERHIVEAYDLSIPLSVFFIFIPLDDVKSIKSEVLSWIKSKKPLLS